MDILATVITIDMTDLFKFSRAIRAHIPKVIFMHVLYT